MTATSRGAPAAAGQGTVLLVEDNRDLCENLSEILGGRGYAVTCAYTVQEALESARGAPPDVAIIDLNLPDGDGTEVLSEIRHRSPGTACVVFTGNASLGSAVQAVNRGAYAYLLKGGRIEEVMTTVDRAAEKVRLEREKVRLERALTEERNFSRAIVGNAAMGIIVVEPGGRILEANAHMTQLLLGKRPEAAGALVRLVGDPRSAERLRRILEGTEPVREHAEFEVHLEAGRPRLWRVRASTLRGQGARGDAVVALVTDITAERDLQRKVLEASRLAAVGEMAARVAHEIRNPLAGIAGAIRVLTRDLATDPKRESFSRELLALVARLNAFVEDLLLYARPLRVMKEEVALAAVVDPLKAILREHPVMRGIAFEVEDRLGRPLRVDRHLLGMALQNLVQNSAQAMKGKGRVRVEAVAGDPGRVLLTVEDSGPGIPVDVLPHLFEAFATTRIEGTGLGLSTAKRIVEAHGGTIGANNRAEGGARFEIRLPS